MNILETLFAGYYEKRLDGDIRDPKKMMKLYSKVVGLSKGKDEIPELMSEYGREAEKIGFVAGFRMAWELLKSLQEEGGTLWEKIEQAQQKS